MVISSLNSIRYRRFLFTVKDNFLLSDSKPDAGINYFIQSPDNVNGLLNEFPTLLIDLEKPQEMIWDAIYHRTRTEIGSFIHNQQYEHAVLQSVSSAQLSSFIHLFNRFARHKKIRKAEAFRLKAYNRHGLLAISYIRQDSTFLCINFYRLNTERATNLYSFNLKHELNGTFNQSHIGRAHRALHWLDILAFKAQKVHYYDFCGWYSGSDDRELLNINKFKEQFTQHKVMEYSGVIYTNRLLLLLLKLIR